MTDRHQSYGPALDEYTKSVPPGWMPGIYGYPLKLYLEKFDLWKRQTNVTEDEIGVTMVGRLKGKAYRVAMKIRIKPYITNPDTGEVVIDQVTNEPIPGPEITGSEAIAFKKQVHPTTGAVLKEAGYVQRLHSQ